MKTTTKNLLSVILTVCISLCLLARANAIEHVFAAVNDENRNSLIRWGTMLYVELDKTVSSKTCKQGDTFSFHVVDEVDSGTRTAIPIGTPGSGTVMLCHRATYARGDGYLGLHFNPIVLSDGTEVVAQLTRESLTLDENDKNGTGSALEDIANMSIPGFFILDYLRKGTDTTVESGHPFHIATVEDSYLSDAQ